MKIENEQKNIDLEQLEQCLTTLKINPAEVEYEMKSAMQAKQGLFNQLSNIVELYVKRNLANFNLHKPTIEGESKKIYSWNGLALVELKPTMYSFTYNRYGIVEGTDSIRVNFWKLFGTMLNNEEKKPDDNKSLQFAAGETAARNVAQAEYPFLSNFLGTVKIEEKEYVIIRYLDKVPPLEVVWKNYLVGTMKHNLKTVDNHPTRAGTPIVYEGKFPAGIIRFDWRNPLPDKDECIPDEFAEFYMNTSAARRNARHASELLNKMLMKKGYELVDLCYFMDYDGSMICSEITPDGMRIKKKGKSYDKDLWRAGKDKATITETWNALYEDLK